MKIFVKKILIFIIIFSITISFFSCGKKENNIIYNLTSEPKNLDPQVARDTQSITVIQNIFEGLVKKTESGEIVPAAAEEYSETEQKNGKYEYKFILSDSEWSDGKKVSAYDFEYALLRALDKNTGSADSSLLFCIDNAEGYYNKKVKRAELGIKVTDEKTLVITLSKKNNHFLDILTLPVAMPCRKDFFVETKGRYGLEDYAIISNGVYKLERWSHNNSLVLAANENYKNSSKPIAEKVVFRISGQQDADSTDFGKTGLSAGEIRYNQKDSINEDKYIIEEYVSTTWVLAFNTSNNIYNNLNIRRSFVLGLDKALFKDYIDYNFFESKGLIPPSILSGDKSYRELAGKVELGYNQKAAASEYQKGIQSLNIDKLRNVTLLAPDSKSFDIIIGYIQQSWQKSLSLYVNIERVPENQLLDRVYKLDYEIALLPFLPAGEELYLSLARFLSNSSKNFTAFSSKKFDDLMDKAYSSDNAENIAYIKEAEKLLLEEAIVSPVVYEASYFVKDRQYADIKYSPYSKTVKFFK